MKIMNLNRVDIRNDSATNPLNTPSRYSNT